MKCEQITLRWDKYSTGAVLFAPERPRKTAVVLAHGAGAGMDSPFLSFFQKKLADAGYACLKFNFPYMDARRRGPDPQPVLFACYREAIRAVHSTQVVIGGKSMGGRIASYLGEEKEIAGLFFLGYPLHPPGKPDQLRDKHLYSIGKPMFFASGTRDPFARMDLLEKTLKKIPDVTQLLISDGGHSFEVPKRSGRTKEQVLNSVYDALIGWLQEKF